MSSLNPGTIDNAVKGLVNGNIEAARTLFNTISSQLQALSIGTGVQLLEPTSGGKPQTPNTPTPPTVQIGVTGANGAYTIAISPPTQTISAALYYEVSYSTSSNFSSPTVLPLTPSTGFTYNAPGTALFWRVRATYDKSNFGAYASAGTASVASGLQSSAATSDASVLNQTNYATVDSQDNGTGTANVRIYGQAGPGFMYPAVKGSAESILPSATVINIPFSSNQVVGYDGQYHVQPTLPQVLPDDYRPTGTVGVVGAGAVVLPQVSLVLDSGGHILAWNVDDGGNGITGPVTLMINTSTGSGGTYGAQTITGGKLIAIASGNPGKLYDPADTVAVSGGVFAGTAGGGQAIGGQNGRLIYNDATTGA